MTLKRDVILKNLNDGSGRQLAIVFEHDATGTKSYSFDRYWVDHGGTGSVLWGVGWEVGVIYTKLN